MSSYTPVALKFTAFPEPADRIGAAAFAYLAAEHEFPRELDQAVGRLVFAPKSVQVIDIVPVNVGGKSVAQLLQENAALRLLGKLRVGSERYAAEVYFFPALAPGVGTCLQFKLHSRAYEAIYGYQPDAEDVTDAEAKAGLLGLVFGLAATLQPLAFMLDFDRNELESLDLSDVLARLRKPELTPQGKRPGLITGVRQTILPRPELEAVWGKGDRVYETVAGYAVLDCL